LQGLRIEAIESNGIGPCSLEVAGGECVCVSGTSGAGKTLLLRAIADLDPHHGKVFLDDVECNTMEPGTWRHKVGLLPAESQWWYETVGEHFGNEPESSMLVALGFERDVFEYQTMRLSSGERQRLGLLRLLSNLPDALLLDEPTSSLDAENIHRVERLIEDYRTQHHIPVIWVSHDLQQIARVSDRYYRIVDGKFIA
jgi:ABC-type iron transport system FetAB ATPase subunit